jgi:hypothetical protein
VANVKSRDARCYHPWAMKRAGEFFWRAILLLVVVAAALGAYNVFSDNTPVVKAARLALACPSENACQLSRYDRRPWEQRFEFYQGRQGKVVRCRPAYVLAGPYACKVTDEAAAPPQFAR